MQGFTIFHPYSFSIQLSFVLIAVEVKNVHQGGSSFGAVIASDYAHHHPDNVQSIILVEPAGWPDNNRRNWLLDIQIVSDLVFHHFGVNILRSKVEDYFLNLPKHTEMVEKWSRYASIPGYTHSALSTLRYSPVLDNITDWQQLGELEK